MKPEQVQRWLISPIALVVFLNGLLALYRPLAERFPERLERLLAPVSFEYLGRSLDLIIGITLIYVAYQLLQRKRVAWVIGLLAGVAVTLVHLVISPSYLTVLSPAAACLVLIASSDYFKAKSELKNIRQGLITLISAIVLALAYGTVGFWLMYRRDFGFDFSLIQALTHTLRAYLLIGNPDLIPHTRHARWFLDSLGILGASSLLYGVYSLFRPLEYRYRTLPHERLAAYELVQHYSGSSEDFFKLWPSDKSYFFSSDGQAVIAYAVSAGIALVVGDPVGKPSSLTRVLHEFLDMCAEHSWAASFLYVTDRHLKLYEQTDMSTLKTGEDAIVDLVKFATETASSKHFRNIKNRFEKANFTAERHLPPHSPQLLREVSDVSRRWMSQSGRKEWKFLAGYFNRDYLQQCPLFVARDDQGKLQAFVNEVPSYFDKEATIDLMRHRPSAPSNVMDWLFMRLLLELKQQGYQRFSLGLAPLSGLDNPAGKPEEKLLDLIYRSNQRFISFQGLRQFKSKFDPVWEPKYVAYQGNPTRMPRIALALSRVLPARH